MFATTTRQQSLFWFRYVCFALTIAVNATPLMSFSPSRLPSRSASCAQRASITLLMNEQDNTPAPTSFREAEVLGLKLMQEGSFEDALAGTFNLLSREYLYMFMMTSLSLSSSLIGWTQPSRRGSNYLAAGLMLSEQSLCLAHHR